MPRLIRLLGRLGFRPWIRPFQKALERPWESQESCLRNIIKRNMNTVYGKHYGFGDIRSPEEYQQQVPISTYNDMQPYFESIGNGTPNVLFPDPVICFLLTSGTSGQPKLLPLSNAGLADFHRQDFIVFGNLLQKALRSDAFSAHLLTFSAPEILPQRKGKYPVGYITGVISTQVPTLYKFFNRIHPTRPVLNMTDWKTKLYQTALETIGQDIRVMFGMPSNIVAFLRALVQDLAPSLLSDDKTSTFIKNHLRRSMVGGELQLNKLWPEMRTLIYGGVHVEPYLPFLKSHFESLATIAIYWATEGALGLQVFDEGINLALDTVFFEFLPEGQLSDVKPLMLSDVKRKTTYHILITTVGGFYRYDIGDLIQFTNLDPPTIEIVGRAGTVASIAGERLLEQQVVDALKRSCDAVSASIAAFTVVPNVSAKRTGYDIYVEFLREPKSLTDFETSFDEALCQLNFGFQSEREADVLSATRFFKVPEGTLARLAEANHPVQGAGKIPVISQPEILQQLRFGN
ncbi:MAG: GH3 auxin-responsive promoter family protein [Promethearchaeota archaeon]